MSEPNLKTIPTSKPGRPKSIRKTAEKIVGVAGLQALEAADLFVVTGAYLRQGNLFLPQVEDREERQLSTTEQGTKRVD